VLDGEGEDDRILGGTGVNVIRGGGGNDTIWSGSGAGEIDCGRGIDTVYGEYVGFARLERGTPAQVQDPLVREPYAFKDCEVLIPVGVKDNPLAPHRLNPQFIDPRQEAGVATNAGLLSAGAPGAGAIAFVDNNNADQPLPRQGRPTQGNDSLSVRKKGALDPDGSLYGLGGDDRLEGDRTDDRLYGGPGNDGIYGRGGNDLLVGSGGRDTIEGGRGQDLLDGGPGNDRLNGGFGDDAISGGPGNDRIVSVGGGRDTINCGSGTDTVIGDRSDVLTNCERRR